MNKKRVPSVTSTQNSYHTKVMRLLQGYFLYIYYIVNAWNLQPQHFGVEVFFILHIES